MAFNLYDSKGCPLEQQHFTWRDLVQQPISKLDDDAYTRVRIILMNSIEHAALHFQHMASRLSGDLQLVLARVRRVEQHQATMTGWLLGADHSPLETTIANEQAAIEVTAALAQRETDAALAQSCRHTLLENVDHLYRYSALLDRLEGKDANNILQSYTDILPGRPTREQHRAPRDDLHAPYRRETARPASKLQVLMLNALAQRSRDYYLTIGPLFSDPVARQLYAEIASVKEQHATRYGTLPDPAEHWLEQWLLHEAAEVYAYHSCVEQESNHHMKAIWERFLDYELGHFHLVSALYARHAQRDPALVVPPELPAPLPFRSQRGFIRQVLAQELGLPGRVDAASDAYRAQMNRDGSPSDCVAAGYAWVPGTELNRTLIAID